MDKTLTEILYNLSVTGGKYKYIFMFYKKTVTDKLYNDFLVNYKNKEINKKQLSLLKNELNVELRGVHNFLIWIGED
jgi:hypothetical protein